MFQYQYCEPEYQEAEGIGHGKNRRGIRHQTFHAALKDYTAGDGSKAFRRIYSADSTDTGYVISFDKWRWNGLGKGVDVCCFEENATIPASSEIA